MDRMLSTEVREPERLVEEPAFGEYPLSLYDEERYPELLDVQPRHRQIRERKYLPKPEYGHEEVRELPQPRQVAKTPPVGSVVKLKAGERIIKRWSSPVWFMRMSDVKNVMGHDVYLTRLRSGNYAFRGVDDETFENLYRIVGKRPPSEADTFGPLRIKSRGKKSRGYPS